MKTAEKVQCCPALLWPAPRFALSQGLQNMLSLTTARRSSNGSTEVCRGTIYHCKKNKREVQAFGTGRSGCSPLDEELERHILGEAPKQSCSYDRLRECIPWCDLKMKPALIMMRLGAALRSRGRIRPLQEATAALLLSAEWHTTSWQSQLQQ